MRIAPLLKGSTSPVPAASFTVQVLRDRNVVHVNGVTLRGGCRPQPVCQLVSMAEGTPTAYHESPKCAAKRSACTMHTANIAILQNCIPAPIGLSFPFVSLAMGCGHPVVCLPSDRLHPEGLCGSGEECAREYIVQEHPFVFTITARHVCCSVAWEACGGFASPANP